MAIRRLKGDKFESLWLVRCFVKQKTIFFGGGGERNSHPGFRKYRGSSSPGDDAQAR